MPRKEPENQPANYPPSTSPSLLSFTEMTQQLQAAYRELDERYEALNRKLQETNIELRQSLGEKERLSTNLNNILENLNSGVVVVDTKGFVRLFNRAAERILKCEAANIIGKEWNEVSEALNNQPGCLETLRTGRLFTDEEKIIANSSGALVNVGYSTSILRAPDNEVLGAVEVFYDLTKLKHLEREMARISTLAALGRMAATIAHEVRNPLGAVSGFAALLGRDIDDYDPRKNLIIKITSGVASLNKIVNGLLDFTRDPRLQVMPVNLDELIDEAIENVTVDNKTQRVEIEKYIDHDLATYPLDKDCFRQIMINLINNAIQASAEGGKVKIILHRKDSQIRVEVVDQGKGIPEQVIDKIFDPFFTTREKGTGLGLAIVKKLVNAHGGTIFAESAGLDRGARFVISLPSAGRSFPR